MPQHNYTKTGPKPAKGTELKLNRISASHPGTERGSVTGQGFNAPVVERNATQGTHVTEAEKRFQERL